MNKNWTALRSRRRYWLSLPGMRGKVLVAGELHKWLL